MHACVTELLAQGRGLQTECDTWQQEYWDLFQQIALLRARHRALCLRFEETTGNPPPPDDGEEPVTAQ